MVEKIIRADKKTKVFYLILIVILIAAALLIYGIWQNYYGELNQLAENHPDQALMKIMNLVKVIIIINPVITAFFMIYFIVLGTKTYRSRQFPPPGIKVIRDTRLTEGEKARKYAMGLWFIAAILFIFAISITVLLSNFIKTIY
jgi:hypothetical protein